MAWSSVPLPVWLRWVGVGIGIAGGALLVWTLRSLGTNITDTVVNRRQHTLVTTGPYQFVRHPFYAASALAFTANALATANWFIALMGGLAMALLVLRTAIEEAHLVKPLRRRLRALHEADRSVLPAFGVRVRHCQVDEKRV